MDVTSYPLVPLNSSSAALIPWRGGLIPVVPTPLARPVRPRQALGWFILFLLLLLRRCRCWLTELRQQANYWRAMHQRARQREQALRDDVQLLRAQLRELEQRFYGRKSEKAAVKTPTVTTQPRQPTPRRRGQQRGHKGHARRNHEHLPAVPETCELPLDQRHCPQCHQPFDPIPGADAGTILEVEVRAHRRVYRRQRYRPTCTCGCQPGVITAPPPPKLIPKSNLGVSIWVNVLVHKFAFFQPLYRILGQLRNVGLDLPAGTITDGLQKLVPLFQPLYQALIEHNRQADHWHADETRWLVFVRRDDKAGFTWTLWVFAAKDSVVYVLDPTRAHDVPEKHLDGAEGILNVDRYSAYKAMNQVKAGTIRLAFCWAHVRRDFLAVLTGWPELTDWAWSWVLDIATLYQRNHQRLAHERHTPAFAEADRHLRAHVAHLEQRRDDELMQPTLRLPQKKVLTSLKNHWEGLTIFVEQPHVPMDNNEAERRERGPVVARKNFYGSGALWSGRLAAMLFSLFQTLGQWHLNVHDWLMAYLNACAQAGGQPPPNPAGYLPWNLSAEQRQAFQQRRSTASTSTSQTAANTQL